MKLVYQQTPELPKELAGALFFFAGLAAAAM